MAQHQRNRASSCYDLSMIADADARRALGEVVEGGEEEEGTCIKMGEDTFVVGKKKKIMSDRLLLLCLRS